MSYEGTQPVKVIGAVAGADLSASTVPYKFVKFSTTNTGRVVLCSATTDVPCGIIQGAAPTSALDQPVEVVMIGQSKLQSDGTLQSGNQVMTNASGQGTPTLATGYCVARAGADAAAAGAAALCTVFVNCASPVVHA